MCENNFKFITFLVILCILPSAESLFFDVMFTHHLSDIAMCYGLLAFYVLLKIVISGNPFQLPLHHLLCIWLSYSIRSLSKKWPMAECISDRCRITEHRGLADSAFGRMDTLCWIKMASVWLVVYWNFCDFLWFWIVSYFCIAVIHLSASAALP